MYAYYSSHFIPAYPKPTCPKTKPKIKTYGPHLTYPPRNKALLRASENPLVSLCFPLIRPAIKPLFLEGGYGRLSWLVNLRGPGLVPHITSFPKNATADASRNANPNFDIAVPHASGLVVYGWFDMGNPTWWWGIPTETWRFRCFVGVCFFLIKDIKKDSKRVVGIMSFIYSLSMWRVVFIVGVAKSCCYWSPEAAWGHGPGRLFATFPELQEDQHETFRPDPFRDKQKKPIFFHGIGIFTYMLLSLWFSVGKYTNPMEGMGKWIRKSLINQKTVFGRDFPNSSTI